MVVPVMDHHRQPVYPVENRGSALADTPEKAAVENAVKNFSTKYVTSDKISKLSFKTRGRKV